MFNSETQSLDEYLSQIARQLRALPARARADELREIEAHLGALVEAGQQLEDISEAEATAAALKQFGAPRRVGRNLRRAWERKQPEELWRTGSAFAASLLIYKALGFVNVKLYILYLASYHIYISSHSVDLKSALSANPGVSLGEIFYQALLYQSILSLGVTLIVGYVLGLISPKRGIALTLPVMALMVLPSIMNVDQDGYFKILNWIFDIGSTYLLLALSARLGAHLGRKRYARIAN